jgi:hypothetical protein
MADSGSYGQIDCRALPYARRTVSFVTADEFGDLECGQEPIRQFAERRRRQRLGVHLRVELCVESIVELRFIRTSRAFNQRISGCALIGEPVSRESSRASTACLCSSDSRIR